VTDLTHDLAKKLILRHFALRISSSDERAMRRHLTACSECRAAYERHLLLASLVPTAASDEQRLANGLGFSAPAAKQAFALPLGLVATAAAMFALFSYTKPDELTARGHGEHERVAQVLAYRVQPGKAAVAVSGSVHRSDELAFAYVNAAGFEKLMIFAVDEHAHVYWYHPAWSSPTDNPRAIDIAKGPELRELPEAIAHQLDGKSLKIHALFTNANLSVRDVERMLKERASGAAGSKGSTTAAPGDAVETEMTVVVE
jgi:hypothetical protein